MGQSWGRPRVCMRMVPQWSSAQVADMSGSQRWPLTSLTISAPASMARRAVEAWKVSTERMVSGRCWRMDCDDGEDAGLLFFGGERGGVGAGGFAADVEDVGAFVEHGDGLGEGAFGGVLGRVEVAAVGEGVGRDVEDAHDEGSPAEREGAGAQAPVEAGTRGEGHGRSV